MKLTANSVYLALLLATAGEVNSGAPDPAFLPGLRAEYEFEKRQLEDAGAFEKRQAGGSTFSPPYYPAPKGGWLPDWSESYQKAAALVGQMTLAEKVNVTTTVGWSMVSARNTLRVKERVIFTQYLDFANRVNVLVILDQFIVLGSHQSVHRMALLGFVMRI